MNVWGYVGQNPLGFVDPTGEAIPAIIAACAGNPACAAAVSAGIGAISGAAIDLATQLFSNGGNLQCVNKTDVVISALAGAIPLGAVGAIGGKLLHNFTVKRSTEVVQRAMSRLEFEAIRKSGVLSRDGRPGPHHVSNAINSSAIRARQRLSLPQTPEVRATLAVPKGIFSSPSKVKPDFRMPGGGLERTAPGNLNIPARIIRIDNL